jgi:hypothetical protein
MANGDTLVVWGVQSNEPPSANAATLDTRNQHLVLDFDAATDEEAVFSGVMPQNYAGGNIDAKHKIAASSATSGNVVIQGAFENLNAQDKDSDGFAAFQSSGAVAVSGTSGIEVEVSITFTNAQADSLSAGQHFRYKVRRDADDTSATDNVTGDIELGKVELRESS